MSELVNTKIPSQVEPISIHWFLHGVVRGKYDLLIHVDVRYYSINFHEDEDASMFVVGGKEGVFMDILNRKPDANPPF